MREIKFRAWDKYNKKMLYQEEDNGDFEDLLNFLNNVWELVDSEEDKSNFVFMQSTNLHDKNGKEIYEGDIVKFGDFGIKEVVFWEGCFAYMINKKKGHLFDPKECEVIGNKFENPELLEGES